MKVEYKNIIGILDKDSDNCDCCCFSKLTSCIPYYIHKCYDHIFINGKTQIFELWNYHSKAKHTVYADRVRIVSFMVFLQIGFGVNFLLMKYIGFVKRRYDL